MKPSGPTSGIPQTLAGLQRPAALSLQVGQQLQATVLDNTAGRILLAIGHRQLSAESSLPFERGQALTLQVRSLGEQPVLRVIAALQESPAAMAVRTLLPRYGASTPLLASLSQLARSPQWPVAPLVREAAGNLVRQLPDVATLSTARGVKTALRQSGLFLENHLAQADRATAVASTVNGDYKANLLRLVHLLRQWPGSSQAAAPPTAGRATQSPATGATPYGPAASPTTGVAAPPPAKGAPPPPVGHTPETVPPQTVQRAIQGTATAVGARPSGPTAPAAGAGATVTPTGSSQTASPATPGSGNLSPPPPFAGVIPTAQSPVQAGLDLLNRLGNLRLDLLQQAEAALARVHLNQLASRPRDGEHRLVEWLFDIPLRRGNDIDLWSARIYRDVESKTRTRDRPAASWRVQLAFDLPGLGPMQAQIELRGERVSTRFWAAQQETLPVLQGNLHTLREAMLEAGLEVGDMDCQAGTIPDTPGRNQDPLISEKA